MCFGAGGGYCGRPVMPLTTHNITGLSQRTGEGHRPVAVVSRVARAFEVRGPNDLPGAFAAMADWRAAGLSTLTDGMLFTQRERVVELALKGKLPGVYPEAEFVAPRSFDVARVP